MMMMKVRLFMIVFKTIHALVHVCIHPTTLRVIHQGIVNLILSNHLLQAFSSYYSYPQNILLFLSHTLLRFEPQLSAYPLYPIWYISTCGCAFLLSSDVHRRFWSIFPSSNCVFLFTAVVSHVLRSLFPSSSPLDV